MTKKFKLLVSKSFIERLKHEDIDAYNYMYKCYDIIPTDALSESKKAYIMTDDSYLKLMNPYIKSDFIDEILKEKTEKRNQKSKNRKTFFNSHIPRA